MNEWRVFLCLSLHAFYSHVRPLNTLLQNILYVIAKCWTLCVRAHLTLLKIYSDNLSLMSVGCSSGPKLLDFSMGVVRNISEDNPTNPGLTLRSHFAPNDTHVPDASSSSVLPYERSSNVKTISQILGMLEKNVVCLIYEKIYRSVTVSNKYFVDDVFVSALPAVTSAHSLVVQILTM